MNRKEEKIFKYLMAQYSKQWHQNKPYRESYDENLAVYLGETAQEKFPLSYNESFNRILPIIYTMLSRFMSQMYQTDDIVSVKPRKRSDIENAKAVEAVLNYQMDNLNAIDTRGGSYLVMMKWFFNALTFGKGIVKCYWKKEERITPRRVSVPRAVFDDNGQMVGTEMQDILTQDNQIVYNAPYVEVLNNKTFIPDIEYKSIQDMPFVFLVYNRSVDELHKLQEEGIYKNIKDLGWQSSGTGGHPQDSMEGFVESLNLAGGAPIDREQSEFKAPYVDVIECYTKLILEDSAYEVGSGIKIKGKEEECIVHIGNYKTILSIQRNPYGIRPLFDIGCYMHPSLYWDVGLVELTKGIQSQVNTLANLRMQNVMLNINTMLRVDPDADIDPEALVIKPFGVIPAEKGEIEPLIFPDTAGQAFQEQERFFNDTIQDLMGCYSFNMGQSPVRQEKTGVVQSITSMGEARVKLLLMSMDYLGIRPLLQYMMILNTYHLPQGFEVKIADSEGTQFKQIFGESIHSDYNFVSKYTASEPSLDKNYRAQQLIQLSQMWQQSPWINQYQFIKSICELLGVKELDGLLRTPEQIMQESKQQQQAQMVGEQQRFKQEVEKVMVGKKADFESKHQLNEQEFGHDVAMAEIKHENNMEEKGE